jgi:hypothetical protein
LTQLSTVEHAEDAEKTINAEHAKHVQLGQQSTRRVEKQLARIARAAGRHTRREYQHAVDG